MLSSVLIYGCRGFVGRQLYQAFVNTGRFKVYGVTRETFLSIRLSDHHIVLNCSNSARRYLVNCNSILDFEEIQYKSSRILERHGHLKSRLILISTLSCRTEANTPYGRNRLYAEEQFRRENASIIRLGPMYGGNREKDTLHDLCLDNHVHYLPSTRYSYADVTWISSYIASNIEEIVGTNKTVREIGARNSISLGEIAQYIQSRSTFSGKNDDQYVLGFPEGPDSYQVLEYALQLKKSAAS
jgi:nucleoside-diphosphate-sugar epimerase